MKFSGTPKEYQTPKTFRADTSCIKKQQSHCDACSILVGEGHIYKELKTLRYNGKEWHLDSGCYKLYKKNVKLLRMIKY